MNSNLEFGWRIFGPLIVAAALAGLLGAIMGSVAMVRVLKIVGLWRERNCGYKGAASIVFMAFYVPVLASAELLALPSKSAGQLAYMAPHILMLSLTAPLMSAIALRMLLRYYKDGGSVN